MRFQQLKLLLVLSLSIIFSSCSLIDAMAVKTTGNIMDSASADFSKEYDWDRFSEVMPGNLKMLEGLHYNQPSNLTILTNLIKGYSAYAFAVSETKLYDYQLRDFSSTELKATHSFKQAISYYNLAISYAEAYYREKGVDWNSLLNINEVSKIKEIYEDNFGDDDHRAVFFTAQALGGLLNLNRANTQLLSLMPLVETSMNWVCQREPDLELGGCQLFKAIYTISRPKMLGGDPEAGQAMFQKLMKKAPHNLLLAVSYLQFWTVPNYEEDEYAELKRKLKGEFAKWSRTFDRTRNGKVEKNYFSENALYNLYNSIAKKRFELIVKNESEIF